MRKSSLLLTLWFVSISNSAFVQQACGQDSLYRSTRQVAAKITTEGLGLDLCLFDRVGIDATSFLIYNTAKVRFQALSKNTTPIVGAGFGNRSAGAGGTDGKDWTVLFVGWEHGYEGIFFQFIVQYALQNSNGEGAPPFPINIALGVRF